VPGVQLGEGGFAAIYRASFGSFDVAGKTLKQTGLFKAKKIARAQCVAGTLTASQRVAGLDFHGVDGCISHGHSLVQWAHALRCTLLKWVWRVDVWALGITAFWLLYEALPWDLEERVIPQIERQPIEFSRLPKSCKLFRHVCCGHDGAKTRRAHHSHKRSQPPVL